VANAGSEGRRASRFAADERGEKRDRRLDTGCQTRLSLEIEKNAEFRRFCAVLRCFRGVAVAARSRHTRMERSGGYCSGMCPFSRLCVPRLLRRASFRVIASGVSESFVTIEAAFRVLENAAAHPQKRDGDGG
jgi:hypothetical protein